MIIEVIAFAIIAGIIMSAVIQEGNRLAHKRRIERRYRDFKNRKP